MSCVRVRVCVCVRACVCVCDPMDCSPPGSSVHGICQVKNTGVGCHFLLQGIFPIQGSNLDLSRLLHWQKDSSPLHHWEVQNALQIPRTPLILVGK